MKCTEKNNKVNKVLIILVIILSAIIVFGLCFGFWLFKDNNSNNDKNTNKSNKNETDEIIIEETDEFILGKYKFSIPEGYNLETHGNYNYIRNNEFLITCLSYPLTYKKIIENKDYILDEMSKQGYSADILKENNENKYVLASGKMNSVDYGFVFIELDSDTSLFITITSNYLAKFDNSWFDKVLSIIESGTKIDS